MCALRYLLLAALTLPLPALAQVSDQARSQEKEPTASSTVTPQNANRFVVGVLVDARTIRVDGTERFHQLIKLENREGRQLVVDLGASPPPEALGMREGDLVVALGKSARINGHPVLYAHLVAPLTELSELRQRPAGPR